MGTTTRHDRDTPPAWLPPNAAAGHLGISRRTMYRLLEAREIPFSVVGNRRRISIADLDRYTKRRRGGKASS